MDRKGERDPYYDNIKGILIVLVVFGHVIQKYIHHTLSYLYIPFIIIYTFHMPLFVFLSGYFSKDALKAQAAAFERFLLPYILWALVYFLVVSLTGWRSDFNFTIPWFAYWYFLSLFTLCLFLPILLKIRFNVLILFVLMGAVGYFGDYGWQFSLSRTICFAPFFLLGYYCQPAALETLRRYRIPILIIGLLALAALILLCLTPLVQLHIGKIEHSLWLAESYQASRVPELRGLIYRGIIIAASLIFGSLILAWTPRHQGLLSFVGRNSLIIFIFHGYAVQWLNDFAAFDPSSVGGVLTLAGISLGITALLSLPIWNRAYRRLMGLIQRVVIKSWYYKEE